MEFKDYYKVMGLERSATPEDIKRAYRKLARKYHPDVSKEKDAELRFKELAEANVVLKDPEKRAEYDRLGANYKAGQEFQPPPEWAARSNRSSRFTQGFEESDGEDQSAFFEALFRDMGGGETTAQDNFDMHGQDQHAKIHIKIEDSYAGATRTIELKLRPDTQNNASSSQKRTIEFNIPKGIRTGQHIRLAAQGGQGIGRGNAGDLYLDVEILPHPLYRTDGHDVLMNLPIAPWEAALGAEVIAPTPTGKVEIKIPAGTVNGRKLRLKGRGLPSKTPGNFYFVLQIVQPEPSSETEKKVYSNFHEAFEKFNPRESVEAAEKTL
jgi:curved DNA-binding protein